MFLAHSHGEVQQRWFKRALDRADETYIGILKPALHRDEVEGGLVVKKGVTECSPEEWEPSVGTSIDETE
ncbi:unnamed protein product [Lampetra planeri]